jgi:hypothetical protein
MRAFVNLELVKDFLFLPVNMSKVEDLIYIIQPI